ncbi:MAG: hypothetical protein ACRYFK_18360 [Janthinobacterium lividum]
MSPASFNVLFIGKAGQVLADPAGFLRVVWHNQPRQLADTQALFEQMVVHLRQHNWSRIFIDQTTMPAFDGIEQAWIATEWLPRAVREGGYRYGAVVESAAVLVRLATTFITTHLPGLPLVYCSFDDEATAVQWLSQQPAQP